MSLFDLQDVCMVIGSLATLDLPMVVDLIGIYVLKGPYCTLTMTEWFLQALSVIPRGSWGYVARRFTMIRWASPKLRFRSDNGCGPTASCIPEPLRVTQADEGLVFPVVDLIRRIYRHLHLKSQIPCEFGWSQAPRRQQASPSFPALLPNTGRSWLCSVTLSSENNAAMVTYDEERCCVALGRLRKEISESDSAACDACTRIACMALYPIFQRDI
ncbi:hypothetical protein F511_35029 [Dorcoceras hygrometricum]|uniref:Uncharacterized protein n=1 Tax=Dorcoceras hygrometricum TaxID=472368 RepID=A0A2Z7CYX4_9LAMI|nr:hypothetical protein F511_35029 [Dorcoceras hygrometricum]